MPGFLLALGGPPLLTWILVAADIRNGDGAFFVLLIVLTTMVGGFAAGLLSALLSGGLFAYYFAGPARSFSVQPDTALLLLVFLAATSVAAKFIDDRRIARERAEAERARAAMLARVSEALSEAIGAEEALASVTRLVVPEVSDLVVAYMARPDGRAEVVAWTAREGLDPEGVRAAVGWAPAADGPPSPVGRALWEGEPSVLRTIPRDMVRSLVPDEESRSRIRRLNAGSAIVVPLGARGRTFGALAFTGVGRRRFTGEDLDLAKQIGHRTGLVLDNAQLYDAEREARAATEVAAGRTRRLQEVTAALAAAVTPEEVASIVVEHATPALGAYAGSLVVMDAGTGTARILHTEGYDRTMVDRWRSFPVDDTTPIGRALGTGEPVLVRDRAELAAEFPAIGQPDPRSRSWAAVPLVFEDRVMGAIAFSFDRESELGPDDRAFARAVAQQAAQALERTRLYDMEARARRDAERALERTAALQRITERLSGALGVSEVTEVVVEETMAAEGAYAGGISLLTPDGDEVELIHRVGYPDEFAERYRRFPLDAAPVVAEAVRTREPQLFGDASEVPEASRGLLLDSTKALAVVPLFSSDRVFGTLTLAFSDPRSFGPEDGEFLVATARQCAQALERAGLAEAEREARRKTEAAERRLAFLARFGAALSGSLRYEETLGTIADLVVPAQADFVVAFLVGPEGQVERVVAVHADPAKAAITEEFERRYRPDPENPVSVVGTVLRTHAAAILPEVPDDFAERLTADPEQRRILASVGFRSIVAAPLVARGRVLGALAMVVTESDRRFDPDDLALAEQLGRRAGLAIDNARLYEAEAEARRQAEEAADRAEALQKITAALSGSLTVDEVMRVGAERSVDALGGYAGAVQLLSDDGSAFETVLAIGFPAETVPRWSQVEVGEPTTIGDAVRTLEPVLITSREEYLRRYPHLADRISPGTEAHAAIPLVAGGDPVGALVVSFLEPRGFSEEDRALLVTLARQVTQAIQRARLYTAERAARAEAEAAGATLEFLADASAQFIRSLDPTDVAAALAEMTVPRIGDGAFVYLIRDERPSVAAVRFADPERQEVAEQIAERYPPDRQGPFGVLRAIDLGQPELETDARAAADSAAVDEDHRALLGRLGARSVLVVPLDGRRGPVGALGVVTVGERTLAPEDLTLVEELGRRAGLAIENATLYRERAEQARILQQSLLPPSLPAITGIRLAARYHPAGEGNDVGGDFYDVFEMAEDTWGVVMGDVCGKGPQAAALTALARYTVRTVAMQQDRPSQILETLSEAIRREARDWRFATAAFVRLQRTELGARLSVSCGGHPLPIIVRADGSLEAAGRPGMLLGVVEEPELSDVEVDLGPGDTIVLYTDGVVEHGPDLAFGEVGLANLLSGCAGLAPDEVASRIEAWLAEVGPGRHHDDVAILVLSVVVPGELREVSLEPDPRSAATAREAVERWCEGLPDDLVHDLRLLVSELVTNSVRHADVGPKGHIGLRMWPSPELVRVEVSDGGPGFQPLPRNEASRQEAGWGLHLVGLLTDRWGVDQDGSGRVWFEMDLARRRAEAASAETLT